MKSAFLLERGVAVAKGIWRLRRALPDILAAHTSALSPVMLRTVEALAADWRRLDERVNEVSGEIEALAHRDTPCQRLMTVPGVGPLVSSAKVATIGGGLGNISKRGNTYLRTLFVRAARVVLIKRVNWERYV